MMITYRYLSLSFLLLLSLNSLFAQTEQSFNHQIKLSLFLDADTANGGLTFGTLAPGYVSRNDKGFTHTLEFHRLTWNTSETISSTATNRGVAVRHQVDFPIGPKWKIFQFTLGSSVILRYSQSHAEPKVATVFQTSFYGGEVSIGAIPALHIYPIERLDFSIGALLGLADFQLTSNRTTNPAIPVWDQRNDVFGYGAYLLQFRSLVVGLAYQF